MAAAEPDVRIVDAAQTHDTIALRALLKRGADVNTRQGDGTTALHWAAYWDDRDTASLLIRAGASVNAANEVGVTPLWIATTNGSTPLIAILLKAGADANIAPSTGGTALMRAAYLGNVEAVQLLLTHGASVDGREALRLQTALMWAVAQHHPEVVNVLIQAGADVHTRSKVRRQRVLVCCQRFNGDPGEPTDVEQGGLTPLLFAAQEGDLESAKLLLAAGANVEETTPAGMTALVLAAHRDHGTVAKFLVQQGADPNAAGAGFSALHAAVQHGDLELVSTLLSDGANPNARLTKATPSRRVAADFAFDTFWIGATPYWLAAGFQKPEMMRLLVAYGADPGVTAKDGTSALMAAVWGESPQALIQDGSPRDFAPPERRTLQAVQLAIDLGSEINVANSTGDTALHRAASRSFNSVIRLLADSGAALNVKNQKGQTPLGIAMMSRQSPKGAFIFADDVDLGAKQRRAAQDRARDATIDLLRTLGAKE